MNREDIVRMARDMWKRFVCGVNDHAGMSQLPNGKWKCKKCGKKMRI